MLPTMKPSKKSVEVAERWRTAPRSPLGLIVLWQLWIGPQHVYGIQKLFEQQGKDRVVNVRSRASLYQALERLQRLGLVEVAKTVRGEAYPDRIVYAITDAGREAARVWLRESLAETGGDYPEFIAAISILFGLAPEEARAQLEQRAAKLAAELEDTEAQFSAVPDLPRLFLLEEEYRKAVLEAELAWLRGVIDDLAAGRLTWSEQWLAEIFAAFHPDHERAEATS
jgi:DNA-binding PadR family transcriptional regulator